MRTLLARFARDESGATVIEYGFIALMVAVAAVAGMRALGLQLGVTFNEVAASF